MSTKTTFKRIALVTVAALGFGVMSVAPSSAAINSDTLTLSAATAAQTTAETYTATSAVATLSFLGATGDSASVTAALVSGPAGNTALPYLRLTETASATINEAHSTAVGTAINPNTAVRAGAVSGSAVTTAKFAVYLGTSTTAAPTIAGTYVVRVTPASVGASGSLLGATAQTLTITVTQAAALDTTVSTTVSTSILNALETVTATADATVTGSMTVVAGTAATGTISVALKNAAGSAVTVESYTASILSGPGLLGSGVQTVTNDASATGRAITVRNGDVVGVFPDGSSGVSKIEIRTAAGALIATETVTFFGAVASIVATVVKPFIGVRAETGVITAVAKDAAGTIVTAPTLFITSSDLTVVNASGAAAASSAAGVATFGFTGLKAGTANFTVGNAATAATVSAAAVSVRVAGGTAALDGLKVTLDKSSYSPGEVATITVTPTDVAGLLLANDTYTVFTSAGLVASYALPSGSEAITSASAQNGGVTGTGTAAGIATYKIYMPSIEGNFTLTWTRSADFATAANDSLAGSITVAVSSPGTAKAVAAADQATAAGEEATAAANDATDAALSAAEAAEAATAMAQEAVDAVAELSAEVTKLFAALRAQITTLTNLMIKIQKKVKA